MTVIGVTQDRLDQIELRLVGADHRPWVLNRRMCDENGRALICKGSLKASKKALHKSLEWSTDLELNSDDQAQGVVHGNGPQANAVNPRLLVQNLALFKLCTEATEDMAEFVANAPQDIEDLLAEVVRLRGRLRSAEQEREEFKKEMLSARVEKTALSERLTELRRSLRAFGAVMKECQQ